MKILMLEGVLHENGGVRLAMDFASRWARDNEVRLLVFEKGTGPTASVSPRIPVYWASRIPRRSRSGLLRVPIPLLRHAAWADVIVSTSEVGYQVLLGWAAAKVTRTPFVVLVQAPVGPAINTWVPGKLRPALRWVHRHLDLALCTAQQTVASVTENGLPAAKVAWVQAGIDYKRAKVFAAKASRVPVPQYPYVVTVGRLSPEKDQALLIAAHALAFPKAPHDLVIVGDGPDRKVLEQLAAHLNVSDTVTFTGFLPNPQPLIAGADLFVLPSDYEGMGLVLLEALAHETPVIATDCGGPTYVLNGGAYGEIVPVRKPVEMAAAIVRHFQHPERLADKASDGAVWLKQFDQDVAADEALQFLREQVGQEARVSV